MSVFLDTALEAAKKAEEVILQYFDKDIEVELKADDSPVTIADRNAETAIRDTIRSKFPTHGLLGEEHGTEAGAEDYMWIIDPIDGTKNFTRGIPFFGTLIALMHQGELVLGVSNAPALKELLYAEQGGGAFCNGSPVHVSEVDDLAKAYVHYGGLSRFSKTNTLPALLELGNKTMTYRGFGDCCMYHFLAKGNVDVVIEAKINIWDIAAAAAIIPEAGGVFTDIRGGKIDIHSTSSLASNKHLHPRVAALFT